MCLCASEGGGRSDAPLWIAQGMTTEELEALDCHLILANTYHLALQPGTELVQVKASPRQALRLLTPMTANDHPSVENPLP